MLKSVTWGNFKVFASPTTLPLGRITVLTGINGRGKSTAMQPLLCMSQSRLQGSLAMPIRLDGEQVHLGTAREVRNRAMPDREPVLWSFEMEDEEPVVIDLALRPDEREATFLRIVSIRTELPARDAPTAVSARRDGDRWTYDPPDHDSAERDPWVAVLDPLRREYDALGAAGERRFELLVQRELRYVSADRLGPQAFVAREVLDGRLSVGARGEHTIEVLGRVSDDVVKVSEARLAPGADLVPHTVFDQAVAWMNWIFDGVGLRIESSEVVRTLGLNADGGAHYARPSNIGFGFTCLLPLLVEGLLADSGTLYIVENPEAHLHPAAVSRFARFLGALALNGVQVCVETHSEHLVNGLRLAVAGIGEQPRLAAEDLSILYFRRDAVSPVLRVDVDERGRIATWPEGFFDTAAQDLARLHGI